MAKGRMKTQNHKVRSKQSLTTVFGRIGAQKMSVLRRSVGRSAQLSMDRIKDPHAITLRSQRNRIASSDLLMLARTNKR